MSYLIQITSEYFCAGIVSRDKVVIEAAPIVKYMVGWPTSKVRAYALRKGWSLYVEEIT